MNNYEETFEVKGKWETDADFKVTITGDDCDVREVVEMLRLDGNLKDLKIKLTKREATPDNVIEVLNETIST